MKTARLVPTMVGTNVPDGKEDSISPKLGYIVQPENQDWTSNILPCSSEKEAKDQARNMGYTHFINSRGSIESL